MSEGIATQIYAKHIFTLNVCYAYKKVNNSYYVKVGKLCVLILPQKFTITLLQRGLGKRS